MRYDKRPVWLTGERYDIVYLLTPGRGHVMRFDLRRVRSGPTGGVGAKVGRHFVAVYVHPDSGVLVLRIGHEELLLGGSVKASHWTRLGGLISRLVVQTDDGHRLAVSGLTVARAILARIDPGYDALDESMDDYLSDVADIVNSTERQRWILQTKDPSDGPWHLLTPE